MKMTNGTTTLEIQEHIITKNLWEYYITPERDPEYPNIAFALVMGFETEMGDVDLDEIKPYIWTRTKNFKGVMPAPGWKWVD